jgi:hypothetical protein
MLREVLANGAIRLRTARAAFVFLRLQPGVLLFVASGRDRGEFGGAAVAELSAELERFPLALELFVDATRVLHVSNVARTRWTQWFEARRDRLRRAHVLTASKFLHLSISMTGLESRASIELYDSPEAFAAAMRSAAPGAAPGSNDELEHALTAAAVPVTRRAADARTVILDDGACAFAVHRPAPGVALLTLRGADRGALASEVFDELARARARADRLHLFIDLRAARMPGAHVSDLWAQWLGANRPRLASVVLLAPSLPIYVTASIAQWRSRAGAIMRVIEEPERFEAAILRLAPGFPGLPAAL